MEDDGIFYGHLVHFPAIWYFLMAVYYILWSFGKYFFQFWYVLPRQLWQPWLRALFTFVFLRWDAQLQVIHFSSSRSFFVSI
jgi:hypothetical protein